MLKKNGFQLITVAMLFLANCGDNNDLEISEGVLLREVIFNGQIINHYEYQEDSLLSRAETFDIDGSLIRTELYSYSEDTIFVDVTTNPTNCQWKVFLATEDTIKFVKTLSIPKISYLDKEYIFNGNCNTLVRHYKNEEIEIEIQKEIMASNCSNHATAYLSFKSTPDEYETTFDNKNSASHYASPRYLSRISPHNIIESRILDDEGETILEHSFEKTYRYNSYDYPVFSTRKLLSKGGGEDKFKYVYY